MFSALRPKKPGYFGGDIYGTAKQATQKHLRAPDAELNAEVRQKGEVQRRASGAAERGLAKTRRLRRSPHAPGLETP